MMDGEVWNHRKKKIKGKQQMLKNSLKGQSLKEDSVLGFDSG